MHSADPDQTAPCITALFDIPLIVLRNHGYCIKAKFKPKKSMEKKSFKTLGHLLSFYKS